MKNFFSLKINWRNINIPLLLFLIFFLNVKFVVKLLAILVLIAYSRNLKLGLSWKKSRLPLFYALMILIEIIKYLLLTKDFSLAYALVFGLGILQWCISLLALHQIKLFTERDSVETLHNTVKVFFLLNFLVSFFFLFLVVFFPSTLVFWGHAPDISLSNPSLGDTILGISFDSSIVNATINGIGLIYFIYKREYLFTLLCITIIALCTSNVTFLFIIATLGLMFLTVRKKQLRIAVFMNSLILVLFYFLISPANRQYVRNYFVQLYVLNKNPELVAGADAPKTAIKDSAFMLDGSFHEHDSREPFTAVPERLPDTVYSFNDKKLETALSNLVEIKAQSPDSAGVPQLQLTDADFKRKPGKLISFFQTYNYLTTDSRNFCFGAGMGRFSSKLAFRTAGVKVLGSYPDKYKYTAPEFEKNHLKTFLFYQNGDASLHSVLNYPSSVYNQLLGEYGILGAFLFTLFYLGYFLKRHKNLTYGKYLLVILLGFFFMDYWLELYSLVIVFELLMLLNIKEELLMAHGSLQKSKYTLDDYLVTSRDEKKINSF